MPLSGGAFRSGSARTARPRTRLQLLGLPDDGLPAHQRAAREVRASHRARVARQLSLWDGRCRASVLQQLWREELLPAEVPPQLLEHKRQLLDEPIEVAVEAFDGRDWTAAKAKLDAGKV